MAGQGSNDRIAELLKEACPPAAASPEFKAGLRQHVMKQAAAPGTASPRPLWQQPFLWIPTAAVAAVAAVLVVYFAAFHTTGLTVITSDATGIETTTATLNGDLDNLPAEDGLKVCFEWGVDTGYGRETAPQVATAEGSIQADLSGLAPETTYHYRLKVVDNGDTRYGPDRTFTTGPAPPAVTTGDAASVETGSATLTGSLDGMGSSATVGVSFQWGLTKAYGHQSRIEGKTSTGRYSVEITGLSPGTTYHFRAKADGDGDPVYGADRQFTTGTAPPAVETKEATGTGAGSVRLAGRLTSPGTAESVTVSFVWAAAPGGPYTGTTGDQVMTREGSFSADLSGLQPGAAYYYVARADGDGEPVYGTEKSFLAPTAPPSVTTGRSAEVHAESARLDGVLGGLGTAGTVEVCFEWGPTTDYGSRTAPESMRSPGGFNAALSGLSPGTTYHFRARAAGHGDALGADMMFTTGGAAPEQSTWYLGPAASENASVMYEGDASRPETTVTLHSSGLPSSLVWRANQPAAAGTAYPAGDWTVRLLLSRLGSTESVLVEIGTSDNAGIFLPYGSYTFAGQGDNVTAIATYADNISVSSFSVPSGSYVAARITTAAVHRVYLQAGGSRSFVQSPAYPEPAAPTVTTTAPAEVRESTATLKGYLDGLGTSGSVTVYFEWGLTTDYGSRFDVGYRDSTGDISAAIAALTPNTLYHFRAVAVGDGTIYGADLVFTTLP